MPFQIGITEPLDFSKQASITLEQIGSVSEYEQKEQSLDAFIADKHALFIRLGHYWSEKLLKKAKALNFLCTPTTGLTHIDIDYANAFGIEIVSLKGEAAFLQKIPATAEHTFGLALALLRRYGQAFQRPESLDWDREKYKGCEMKGKRAGIIGMGRVGTQLGGYLCAFGAKLYYYDTRKTSPPPYEAKKADSLASLIKNSDIIFLSASYHKDNEDMIDADALKQMKGKYFVNTSRGEMVDEGVLLDLISKGHFKGVALDVLKGEPIPKGAEKLAQLAKTHNVIVTPHIGGATYESMRATEEHIAEKLVSTVKALAPSAPMCD